jgi:hypothetical protein
MGTTASVIGNTMIFVALVTGDAMRFVAFKIGGATRFVASVIGGMFGAGTAAREKVRSEVQRVV